MLVFTVPFKVPLRDLRHFPHKVSVTCVNAEANAHSADWLMSVFVNELAPPRLAPSRPMYAVNKVSACSSAPVPKDYERDLSIN